MAIFTPQVRGVPDSESTHDTHMLYDHFEVLGMSAHRPGGLGRPCVSDHI